MGYNNYKPKYSAEIVESIRKLYWDEQKSPKEIIDLLHLPIKSCSISAILHRNNIPVRNRREATKLGAKKFRDYYLEGIKKRNQKFTKWRKELVDKVYNMYYNQQMSAVEISAIIGIKPFTIISAIRRSGLKLRSNSDSQKLAHKKHRLSYCRENSPTWKGGRKFSKSTGYYYILPPLDSPYKSMAGCSGYIPEHRYVMAQYLERCLERWEVVHHIDGDKTNNIISNLKLICPREHRAYTKSQQLIVTRIKELEKRVTLLESENALLKGWLNLRDTEIVK